MILNHLLTDSEHCSSNCHRIRMIKYLNKLMSEPKCGYKSSASKQILMFSFSLATEYDTRYTIHSCLSWLQIIYGRCAKLLFSMLWEWIKMSQSSINSSSEIRPFPRSIPNAIATDRNFNIYFHLIHWNIVQKLILPSILHAFLFREMSIFVMPLLKLNHS